VTGELTFLKAPGEGTLSYEKLCTPMRFAVSCILIQKGHIFTLDCVHISYEIKRYILDVEQVHSTKMESDKFQSDTI